MLEITMEGERSVLSFCFLFVEPGGWLRRECGRHRVRKLISVAFKTSLETKELRRHMKRVEDCKPVATEGIHDALKREILRNEKLRRAGKNPHLSAVFYKKNI